MVQCNVEECNRKAEKRGMCNMHYRRWYRAQPGNLSREREQERKRIKENPEKHRAAALRHYHRNKEKESIRHAKYMRSDRGRFVTARLNAKAVGLTWNISYEIHREMLQRPCFYCGNGLHETGSGLDRIDNALGYEIDNVVTCCSDCNMLRGNRLAPEETKVLASVLRAMRENKPLDYYLDLSGTGVTWQHSTSPP